MADTKTQFTLRLPDTVHIKIKKIAKHKKRSMTNYIELLLEKEIGRFEKKNGEILITEDDLKEIE